MTTNFSCGDWAGTVEPASFAQPHPCDLQRTSMKQFHRIRNWVAVAAFLCAGILSSGKSQETSSKLDGASLENSNAVVVEDASQINTNPYVETLRTSGQPPVDYLVNKFKTHDLVFLGEEHGVRENC